MSPVATSLPDDPAVLKALVAELQARNSALSATVRVFEQHIQALQLRIAKLKRQAFGKTSEKVAREIEQLELALEDLLIAKAEASPAPPLEETNPAHDSDAERKPRRRPRVSEQTPRERRVMDPGSACPDCGGQLRHVGGLLAGLICGFAMKASTRQNLKPLAISALTLLALAPLVSFFAIGAQYKGEERQS